MSRTARLWRGVGPLTLGGMLLSAGIAAQAADSPSLSQQLVNLGRQAASQGRAEESRSFYRTALKLEPANAEARSALARTPKVTRVALRQDPVPVPAEPLTPAPANTPAPGDTPANTQAPGDPAISTPTDPTVPAPEMVPPAPTPAGVPEESPLERHAQIANVAREAFVTDVRQRLQASRDFTNARNPEAALSTLRDALTVVQSADNLPEETRRRLENEVRNSIGATERLEDRINLERAEQYRIVSSQAARTSALDQLIKDQDTTNTLMTEFDSLMAEGAFRVLASGGLGDIDTTRQPFVDARFRAQAARALAPNNLAPWAGMFVSDSIGFYTQSIQYDRLKEYRAMLTWADVDRSGVPFPDTRAIEYPEKAAWQALSERRILRYGDADYLFDRDEKTKAILAKLNERISMNFPNDTPLEDVKRYIQQSTQDEAAGLPAGIPIYIDPLGLQDADKTMASTVSIDLEGLPLKTTLRLMLKQIGLTHTVKDGYLYITSTASDDQPTEIRVYQVADLAIIPMSLMGSGGGGRGGMGGGGMGGGGLGGGMGGGGMGGGMGGGGMGGMGGMMSVPPQDPSAFEEKKSN